MSFCSDLGKIRQVFENGQRLCLKEKDTFITFFHRTESRCASNPDVMNKYLSCVSTAKSCDKVENQCRKILSGLGK